MKIPLENCLGDRYEDSLAVAAAAFRVAGWRWGIISKPDQPPARKHIHKMIKRMLEGMRPGETRVECGRLMVERGDGEIDIYLHLYWVNDDKYDRPVD